MMTVFGLAPIKIVSRIGSSETSNRITNTPGPPIWSNQSSAWTSTVVDLHLEETAKDTSSAELYRTCGATIAGSGKLESKSLSRFRFESPST
ncbi:hypothetical protein OGATHE_004131 [Ogataea polymorpha]|uniref:Uncharacterized protein n=1 Tax=Ogataea polymorpha TaxID=460523 RepID=A0A9P8T4Q3_9ASCO|nr:hypothetical protein OGATHE_004131 [Ogataea polymorpha]